MGYTGIYIFNMANEATKKSTEKLYKPAEVLKHNTKDDLWLIIHGNVYDVTKFIDEHPGGEEVLVDVGGTDATDAFEDIGHSEDARETLATLKLGKLDGVPLPASANASSAKAHRPEDEKSQIPLLLATIVMLAAIVLFYSKN